ncbi:MAG: hypothetical protein P1P73_04995 [Brevefilum sp.]|nr:hypothetical protein [Brevefilum sp.]MDW7754012.1 hypothetical protein [Brevefilum sp.]
MKNKISGQLKFLIAYYGLLQSLHLLVLIRAGFLLLQGETAPFPILPPPGGWQEQTLPFMFGLAGMDVIGIILGIYYSFTTLFKQENNALLGILSLTIFISGAVVFAAGTVPSGAWTAHPISYWSMVSLFAPVPYLYVKLLQSKTK